LLLRTELERPGEWQLRLSGVARHELIFEDDPAGVYEPELWEAVLTMQWPDDEIAVGQQIRRWGRGVPSIWDVLSPPDLSEFLFIEDEFTVRPVPMARWTHFGEWYELELVGLPFYRPARLPNLRSDFTPVTVRDVDCTEVPAGDVFCEQNNSPGLVTTPADDFLNPELGARFTPRLRGQDLDFYIFYGFEDFLTPEFNRDTRRFLARQDDPVQALRDLSIVDFGALSANGPLFLQRPKRQLRVGGAYTRPLGPVIGRLEGAYVDPFPVYRDDFVVLRVPTIQWSASVDYLSNQKFVATTTLIGLHYLTDENLYLTEPTNLTLTTLMRAEPFTIPLWFELRGLWNLLLGDAWLGPSVAYDVRDTLTVQLGVNLLEGPRNTPLETFDSDDFAFFRLRWQF